MAYNPDSNARDERTTIFHDIVAKGLQQNFKFAHIPSSNVITIFILPTSTAYLDQFLDIWEIPIE